LTVATKGPLFVTFTADGNPPSCAPGKARIFIDGKEWGSAVLQPGQNDGGYYIDASPGAHKVSVQMDGVLGGCNTGSMSGWSGTLHVETDADAANGAS
jgi:polyisoprenoid-binding protein YceI